MKSLLAISLFIQTLHKFKCVSPLLK